jgi:hypothetical protein
MFKTISGSKLADCSKSLFSKLDPLARETELIVRKSSRFSAEGFVLGIFKAVINGKASLNQIARNMGQSEGKAMTRQAVHKRVDQSAVAFMMSATGQAIKERWDDKALIVTKRFNRVILEDSSQARTDKRNAEDFPGHGNDKGKTAGCKIDLAFDLLTGEPILEALHLATAQDRELGKDLVDMVKPFDLILRDMGYSIVNTHHENGILTAQDFQSISIEHREYCRRPHRLHPDTGLSASLRGLQSRPKAPQNGQEIP